METVRIYIPHHKNPALPPPLLQSLRDIDKSGCEVQTLVIDNAARDGSVEHIRSCFPEVEIHSFDKNLGFAPALNRAVNAYPSEWVCFLNNDMRVDPNWLTSLLQTARQYRVSCVGSILMDWHGKQIQFAQGTLNWFGKGFECAEKPSAAPYPAWFACGGALLIRRDAFLNAGGFDDDFFMIYEDADLGWRLWLYGEEVWIAPDSIVYHQGHASLKQEDYARKAIYLERNSLALLYKNLDTSSLSILLPLAVQELQLRAQAYRGDRTVFPYSSDGYATHRGLSAFLSSLDLWRKKRAVVQSRRVLSDAAILQRFFTRPDSLWAYCEEHYRRIYTPAARSELQRLLEKAGQELRSSRSGQGSECS